MTTKYIDLSTNRNASTNISTWTFEERLSRLEPKFEQFLIRKYGCGYDVDDLMQAARVGLWMAYKRKQTVLEAKDEHFWFGCMKYAMMTYLRQQQAQVSDNVRKSHQHTDQATYVQREYCFADLEGGFTELLAEDMDLYDLISPVDRGAWGDHDSTQVLRADLRMDLNTVIENGLAGMQERRRSKAKYILERLAEGYGVGEIRLELGLHPQGMQEIMRKIRSFRYTVGLEVEDNVRGGHAKNARTDNWTRKRILSLRAQGYGYKKIAQTIGCSPMTAKRIILGIR